MIKKVLIIFAVMVLAAGLSSCWMLLLGADDSESEIVGEEVGIAYSDGENAFSIYISEPGWAYYKYEDGTVMFYDKSKNDGITGFAISSTIASDAGLTQTESDEVIESLWAQTVSYFGQSTTSLEWYQNEDMSFGEYAAKRYSFTGAFTDTEGEVDGDYFFWPVEDKIYICSFIAYPDDYDEYFVIMEGSLGNFMPITE